MNNDSLINLIQNAVSADIRRAADERGQIGIGELAALLRAVPADKGVIADVREHPVAVTAEVGSYRGYYDQLAIEPGESTTAGQLAKVLTDCIGETYQGYKGGDYTMSRGTAVWVSGYGDASGWAVTGVVESEEAVILTITVEEW